MTKFLMRSRWAVEMCGDLIDVTNLSSKLNASIRNPCDTFCSKLNDIHALRKSGWDTADDLSDVERLAIEELDLLSGCLNVSDSAEAISIGTVFELAPDGGILNQHRTTALNIRIRKNPDNYIAPLDFKAMQIASLRCDHLRQALANYRTNASWHDLYRVLESIQRHYGGERGMLTAFSSDASTIKRSKRTANSFRHAEGNFAPIADPVTLEEASTTVRKMLQSALASQSDHHVFNFPEGIAEVSVPNYEFDKDDVVGLNRLELSPP